MPRTTRKTKELDLVNIERPAYMVLEHKADMLSVMTIFTDTYKGLR